MAAVATDAQARAGLEMYVEGRIRMRPGVRVPYVVLVQETGQSIEVIRKVCARIVKKTDQVAVREFEGRAAAYITFAPTNPELIQKEGHRVGKRTLDGVKTLRSLNSAHQPVLKGPLVAIEQVSRLRDHFARHNAR